MGSPNHCWPPMPSSLCRNPHHLRHCLRRRLYTLACVIEVPDIFHMLKFVKFFFGKVAKTEGALKVAKEVQQTAHQKSLQVLDDALLKNDSTAIVAPTQLPKLSLI